METAIIGTYQNLAECIEHFGDRDPKRIDGDTQCTKIFKGG